MLGIDVGTTLVKAALFPLDDLSSPLAVGRADAATIAPRPGWSEADPELVWTTVSACVRAVIGGPDGHRCEVVAVGLSGTACGAWLLDAQHRPVRRAILWNDGRAVGVVDGWRRDGRLDEVFERSGNVPFPGYTLPVLRWLAEHEPDALADAEHLLFCKDYVRLRLTGEVGSDVTDASYAPFGIHERRWDVRLLELAGVSEHQRLLPELRAPDATAPLLAEVGELLGLRAGIPVAVGATDIVAGCVGGGAVRPGSAVTILGTSANSSVVTAQPELEPHGVGIMAAGPLDAWTRTMLNTCGSTTLDWTARLLTGGDVAALVALAEACDTEDRPVLVPYLANAGVVSPFVDAQARGVLAGLRVDHGPVEVARAAVDGLAFAVADSYASMPSRVDRITAVGGAARSDLLLQTVADATGAVVVRPRGREFGARGAALLAAHAAGEIDRAGFDRAASALPTEREFHPRPDRVATGQARYRAAAASTRALGGRW